jgi:hypothetical protein
MSRFWLTCGAIVLLVLNGALHGLSSQRWSASTEDDLEAACAKLERVPQKVGNWQGEPFQIDEAKLPEETVGRNITIRYVHSVTGEAVDILLACGRPSTMVLHMPMDCYPAHGWTVYRPEARLSIAPKGSSKAQEFWMATFKQAPPTPITLRVLWAWKANQGWEVPRNPRRQFHTAPFLYKIYAIRDLPDPDEPAEGDRSEELLRELLPELDRILGPDGEAPRGP